MNKSRKRIFLEPRLQGKYALAFASMAGLSIIVQATVLNWTLSEFAARIPVEARGMVASQIGPLLSQSILVTFAILTPLTILVGITFSFRLVGPLFAIRRFLGAVAQGEAPAALRLRKGDELHDLCELVNRATDSERARQLAVKAGETKQAA